MNNFLVLIVTIRGNWAGRFSQWQLIFNKVTVLCTSMWLHDILNVATYCEYLFALYKYTKRYIAYNRISNYEHLSHLFNWYLLE